MITWELTHKTFKKYLSALFFTEHLWVTGSENSFMQILTVALS